MNLLAVETSTEACSAALSINGVVTERFALTPKAHTQLILPMLDELMSEAGISLQQLDALAFSRGPGSFTGVRIATGVIQGIALGADLPVVPVSTLAAIAQDYFVANAACGVAFTAMDARMGEIFWGVYRRSAEGFAELLGEEAVTPAADIAFPEQLGVGIGSGWGVYQTVLSGCLGHRVLAIDATPMPRARAIAQLGANGYAQGLAVAVELAMPVYLRDKVAKKESER